MRVLLDANVILDCLIPEKSGLPRAGRPASENVLNACETGQHDGLVSWHSLSIISYYYGMRQTQEDVGAAIDNLLQFLHVPAVGHREAVTWRQHGIDDFEDAQQVASAVSGRTDVIITRNIADFVGALIPAMTPEQFLASYPLEDAMDQSNV